MIVCFKCTAETKDLLDHLLASGAYHDYGEVIAAAVRNQMLLEQEVAEKGAIVIGEQASPPRPTDRQPTRADGHGRGKAPTKRSVNGLPRKKESPSPMAAPQREPSSTPEVPLLFRVEGFPPEPPTGLADLPPDLWSHGQVIPLDRWVLGQYNRLLPAKANARALIRLFMDSPKGLPIGEAASTIADQAALLGDYLRQLDAKLGLPRDDALATAFPTTGEDAEKSRGRYANQFVVYQNSKGELSGLMVDMKLLNVVSQRNDRLIVPTRVAWEFASLTNPVLDETGDGLTDKFSWEERSLLLHHIATSVPVEAFAYRAILEAVRQGHNTPESIDIALTAYLAQDRAETLSASFLASQRSGAVSRMADLGLIERKREGVRVSYAATEAGLSFLETAEAVK